ncbi:MAG TPA: NAD(+) synthase [Candidatus Kapabacteria bacterium]|nr:NAD(+) synthase [Candidatus Kapabacteria bacterium]
MKSINEIGLVRVATVSPKVYIADTNNNLIEIKKSISELTERGVQIAVFPELCLTSYSCGDLFLQTTLITNALQSLVKLKEYSHKLNITIIVGLPLQHNSKLYNVAAVIYQGKILGLIPKQYLSNYGEFYENRWFSSSDTLNDFTHIIDGEEIPFSQNIIFELESINGAKFSIEICEDLWAVQSPSQSHSINGANIIFNLSASTEYLGKYQYRRELVKMQSSKLLTAYVYSSASSLESTSDAIFSGHLLIAENGKIVAESEILKLDSNFVLYDIDISYLNSVRIRNKTFANSTNTLKYQYVKIADGIIKDKCIIRNIPKLPFIPQDSRNRTQVCKEISDIQATALARRFLHTNSQKAVIGLSGGLDSTLALLATIQSFAKINKAISDIICVTMPGFGTSLETKSNVKELATLLNIELLEIDIIPSVTQHFIDIGHEIDNYDITFENSQARMRTMILMDIANKRNGIVIGTGDMSEIALGWSTYNGDQMSMYGLNSGIPKTLIKYIIEWYADEIYSNSISDILKSITTTPISPELLPLDNQGRITQETEKNIGPYILNDFFIYYFIRNSYEPKKILEFAKVAFNHDYKEFEIKFWLIKFFKRFFSQQFKRNSNPDGIKVGSISLSQRADWRMPSEAVVNEWIEDLERSENDI